MRGIFKPLPPKGELPLTPSKGNEKGVCLLRFALSLRASPFASGAKLANCTQLKRRLVGGGVGDREKGLAIGAER